MGVSGSFVLVALVTLAVLASAALPGRGALGGTLYLGLGALVGPRVLGLVEEDTLSSLRPALHVACGWMGLCLGLGLGPRLGAPRRGAEPTGGPPGAPRDAPAASDDGAPDAAPAPPAGAPPGAVRAVLGPLGEWGLCALLLAAALRAAAGSREQPLLGALAGALVCAASGPGLVGWARRLGARGPLTARLAWRSRGDALGALLGLVLLCALLPPQAAPAPAALGRAPFALLATLLLGPLLGGAFTLLAGRRPARDPAWVLLIGVLLLCAGVATRLALPAICVCFLLGLTIERTAADRALYAEIAEQTRGPVEALVLLLCGLNLPLRPEAVGLVAVAVLARAAAKLLAGAAGLAGPARGPGARLAGVGLLGFGPVPLAAALQLELLYRSPGPQPVGVGELALVLGAAQLVVGDVLGPPLLRAVLRRAGELPGRGAA